MVSLLSYPSVGVFGNILVTLGHDVSNPLNFAPVGVLHEKNGAEKYNIIENVRSNQS